MTDYALDSLSTRSFEHLVQSLAMVVIGPGVTPFGDGPDGGREATFNGPVPYPTASGGWDGYGVIQAKFRQRPNDPADNFRWLKEEIDKEISKYTRKENPLKPPNYYVLATNVVLSPVRNSGGKDKIFAYLGKVTKQLGIAGFDVWDYDKLRGFLDAAPGVRRTYRAWITPGDVLEGLLEKDQKIGPDFVRTMANFLEKQFLTDRYAHLEQAGHMADDKTAIARVFIDLPVVFDRPQAQGVTEEEVDDSGVIEFARLIAEVSNDKHPVARPGDGVGDHRRTLGSVPFSRYVLIGGPGQGKSTVGQYICQLHRAHILLDLFGSSLQVETRAAARSMLCDDQAPKLGVYRFPVRIVLNEFARALANRAQTGIRSVLGYLTDQISKKTEENVPVALMKEWLAAHPWVVVFDGFDEVPSSSNRADVVKAIQEFWIDAAGCGADILSLITTRPQGYADEFATDEYRYAWLLPISAERALKYASKLVDVRYGTDEEKKQRIIGRLSRATQEPSVRRLMSSPLQVTIMATLVDQIGQPPQERWRLFRQYYETIYRREMEREIPTSALLRDFSPDINSVHQRCGLILQAKSETAGGTDARLTLEEFRSVVEHRLDEEEHSAEEKRSLMGSIMDAATHRLVFLVGVEERVVGFEIRSLQEFMAADALMSGTDGQVQARLRAIAPAMHWLNVFLFAAGQCFADRQHLRDSVYTTCVHLNEGSDDPVAGHLKVGSAIALEIVHDGCARNQPRYLRSFAKLALELLTVPDANMHYKIGASYDTSLEQVYRAAVEDAVRCDEINKAVAGWRVLAQLIDRGVAWARSIADAHWPTNRQRAADVLRRIDPMEFLSEWYVERMTEVGELFEPNDFWMIGQDYAVRGRSGKELADKFTAGLRALAYLRELDVKRTVLVKVRSLQGEHEERFESPYFVLTSVEPESKLQQLCSIPYDGAKWELMRAIGTFSASPNAATLGRVLGDIAQAGWDGRTGSELRFVPWIMRAILIAAENKDELAVLSGEASLGRFGDFDDWKLAEETWGRDGVHIDDVKGFAEWCGAFGDCTVLQGIPVCGASMGMFRHAKRDADSRIPVRALSELVAKMSGVRGANVLIRDIFFEMGLMGGFEGATGEAGAGRDCARLLSGWSGIDVPATALCAFHESDLGDVEFLSWLDDLGQRGVVGTPVALHDGPSAEGVFKRLQEAYIRNPSRRGLLVWLSYFCPVVEAPSVPEVLMREQQDDGVAVKQAALILRFAANAVPADQAADLVRKARALSTDKRNVVVEMLRSLQPARRMPDAAWGVVQAALEALDGETGVPASTEVWHIASGLFNARASGFGDARTWRKLALPVELLPLVKR